jgi:hypothetical protein
MPMMEDRPTDIERAFEVARSGHCSNITELRALLKSEGCDRRTIEGRALTRQLSAIIAEARDQRGERALGTVTNNR